MASVSINMPSATLTEEERIEELLRWKPPIGLKERFPYSFVGFDKEGAPILMINFGRWKIRSLVEEGGPLLADLDKYMEAMFQRMAVKNENGNNWVIVIDLAGYNSRQVTHFPTLQKVLTMSKMGTSIMEHSLKRGIIINSNLVFQTLWKLVRSILRDMANKMEVYGTNEVKWQKILLGSIDQDELPVSLGGQSHKPLRRPSALAI